MKHTKIIALLLCIVMAAATLLGCTGGTDTPVTTPDAGQQGSTQTNAPDGGSTEQPSTGDVKYKEEIAPSLMQKFQYKSVMQIPRIDKIVVSVGCGDCKDNAKMLESVVKDISAITGQHAVATVARKSVANFKLREGMKVGVKVTLRQDRMWEFMDRLFNVALPRVRDFRGISADAFDGRGNYSLGIREQIIFPEIEYDKIEKLRGMNIAICTTANTDEEARELLKLMGAPFMND